MAPALSPVPAPDFGRPVHAALGLPFDAVDEARAEGLVRAAIAEGRRCFLSTPNLNFAIGSLADPQFRQSVLQSDLNIADGWPVVMAAGLTGGGLTARVTGSGLFERLRAAAQRPPLTVFFFGGPPGAAEAAHGALNAGDGGVRSVGFDAAGFGDVEAMSSPDLLERINASGAGFLLVALGAKKGQAWIMHNLQQLRVPVISHLGAVVNFVAGTVARAPRWVQAAHGEWLWRIGQEPALLRRYLSDGSTMLRLLLRELLPLSSWLKRQAPTPAAMAAARLDIERTADRGRIALHGPWTGANAQPLRNALQQLVAEGRPVEVDLGAATYLDSAVLGLLMLLHGWHTRHGWPGTVTAASPAARYILEKSQAAYLLRDR